MRRARLRTILSTKNVKKQGAANPAAMAFRAAFFLSYKISFRKINDLACREGFGHNFIHRNCEQLGSVTREVSWPGLPPTTPANLLSN